MAAVPAAQATQLVMPAAPPYVPAAQLVHVVAVEAPVATEYLPAEQLAHAVTPAVSWYFPAAQSVHDEEAAALEYFPAGQLLHVAPFKYCPAAQFVHGPPAGPVNPALHVHAVDIVLAPGEFEFAAHAVHVAAAAPEYWPAVQLLHAEIDVAPAATLHEPSTPGLALFVKYCIVMNPVGDVYTAPDSKFAVRVPVKLPDRVAIVVSPTQKSA